MTKSFEFAQEVRDSTLKSPKQLTEPSDTPEVRELFVNISKLYYVAKGFSGTVVRSVGTKYATETSFFTGSGAAKTGGRWNRVGIEAVYASLDVMTATQEAYQNFIVYGLPLSGIRPRVTAGADVSLVKVLDLTDASVRRKLGFSREDLVDEDWRAIQAAGEESWTQAIGRGCYLAGFEGILVPSARNLKGKNIVVFPKNLSKSSKLRMIAADELK
ncbi:MAG: RES family NAD+ phosphorylase [Pirellulaceae bacterium]|nr:RES family NAD+ phosphorylase [Pirellulaceae bacterium]